MRPATEQLLSGLEPDNLLAFMALLGLLRALEIARPEWRPRVKWGLNKPPLRPTLVTSEPVSVTSITEAAALGCAVAAEDHEFRHWKVPNGNSDEARALLAEAVAAGPARRSRANLLAALMSDLAVKDDDAVIATPLCLLFGQGHQYFLERLSSVPRQASPPPRGKGKKGITPAPEETLQEALFQAWERIDATESFRWDPAEDRRYALRFADPSKDDALTVHGANRLAAVGMAIFTVVPATVRGRVKLLTIGVRQAGRDVQITWPIWVPPLSLNGIRTLLTHPLLHESEDHLDKVGLQKLGVHELRRATRISVGKYLNFTRATAVWRAAGVLPRVT